MLPWIIGCFILGSFSLGALPLTYLVVKVLTGINLTQVGTGNIGVAAAFTHAGKQAGIVAVLAEITRGILPVIVAQILFPETPAWQLLGLIALVWGRYLIAKGGGVTNATWGVVVYSPIVGLCSGITGLLVWKIGLSLFPSQTTQARLWAMRWGCLSGAFWVGLWRVQFNPSLQSYLELLAATGLAVTLVVINLRQGDDFGLYKKQRLFSLSEALDFQVCGEKATRLSQLKKAGFKVPSGWVLPAIKNPEKAAEKLSSYNLPTPNSQVPLIVRSSAIGEDSNLNSAAGQYETIGPVNTEAELLDAINRCCQSYWSSEAISYRRQRQIPETGIAVLIQPYIMSKAAGVMFSRHPLDGAAKVIIEAAPGGSEAVVGGQVNPIHLEINYSTQSDKKASLNKIKNQSVLPQSVVLELVKYAQEIEALYHGLPQDIEWGWDGEDIWILQTRPITNLTPIWTRTIAAEVIPGTIRPLTWSINRPLTCGVWGKIFTIVLGKKAADLDFTETATLLGSHAYFNATLLGEIFRMMGLPEQGLEFLLRGQKMGKPPLDKVLPSLPGLWRLVQRERALIQEFQQDYQNIFYPAIHQLEIEVEDQTYLPQYLSLAELLERTENIQDVLTRVTYYNILEPIGLAIRRALFKVSDDWLPTRSNPEVAALRDLQKIADKLAENTANESLKSLEDLEQLLNQNLSVKQEFYFWLETYGYLSEVGTDISVETWREQPETFRKTLLSMAQNSSFDSDSLKQSSLNLGQRWRLSVCDERAILKGEIAEIYGKLLAHLRWTFLAIEHQGLEAGILEKKGDIFFLYFDEIQNWILKDLVSEIKLNIQERRTKFEQDSEQTVPTIVYGNILPEPKESHLEKTTQASILTGIPASVGCIEGTVKICRNLADGLTSQEKQILVVPYTDAGWAPLLLRAKAIISEVGGQLSHGAIIAREYGIPAVMNIPNVMSALQEGQRVRVDGYRGTVELLD